MSISAAAVSYYTS